MNGPKVSVCIPTYNYAGFLPEAVDSVLKQSFTDYEILIIDDCSRDNTKDLLLDYANNDGRIRFKINPLNLGMVNNWNLCLTEAKGDYIKFVFGDDLLSSSEALKEMVALLDLDPDITLVGSARNIIDGKSQVIKVLSHFYHDTLLPGKAVINRCLSVRKNLVGEPVAVMFRKRDAGRGFNAQYRQLVDLEMWFHLLEKGNFAYIREPLCSFRRHGGQETARNTVSLSATSDNFYLYDEYMHKPYITINAFHRQYIRYDNMYRIWKLYITNDLAKEVAVKEIDIRYGYARFLACYPFYKIYKPFLKLYRNLLGQGMFVARHGKSLKR